MDPDDWLRQRLEVVAERDKAATETGAEDPLATVRAKARHLAPSEAVDATILALDLARQQPMS